MDSVAHRLGVAKSDILDPQESGETLAVRMALAETKTINETKEYFEKVS
jgi:hypothetical protein